MVEMNLEKIYSDTGNRILVACPIVPHKMLAFNFYFDSLMNQTVRDFDILFSFTDRERHTDFDREERARRHGMDMGFKRVCEYAYRNKKVKYLFTADSDIWFPPDTLEKMINGLDKASREFSTVCCARISKFMNSWYRPAHHEPWLKHAWYSDGTVCELFNRLGIDNIVWHTEPPDLWHVPTVDRQIKAKDLNSIDVHGTECWHLHHGKYDVMPQAEKQVWFPQFLADKYSLTDGQTLANGAKVKIL